MPTPPRIADITVRFATPADAPAVEHVARLDSSDAPRGPALVAVEDGRIVAALGVEDGHVVADPFAPTAAVVDILRRRARQAAPATRRPRRAPRLALSRA
jgi:hypothetical protein